MSAQTQTYSITGVVSTSTIPVRYASVIFVDQSDSTKRISVLTDTSGRYMTNLITFVGVNNTQPAKFELEQNYPNPFSSSTAISYKLSSQAVVKVKIYDILGREIRTFDIGDQAAGSHGIIWDGRNNLGNVVSPGVYFCQLQARGATQIRKMIFGLGAGNVMVSPPGILTSRVPEVKNGVNTPVLGRVYSIRIANTDSTFPAILAQQIDNVAIQSSTTMNLTVSANNTFSDVTAGVIYPDQPQQMIRGFGGANILNWRPDMTTAQVQNAFGSGPGQIGLSILRLRVPYDTTKESFSEDLPTAKLVQSLGGIVFATPWTPPTSMKSNNNVIGGTLNASSYADFAAYLKKFADYMATNGAPLYAISVQNEPDANVTYESCSWNGTQFLNFMKNNAPAIGIRVMMPESESFTYSFSDPTLNDSAACANTAIIAGHLYGPPGGVVPAPYPLAVSKGKELWMTEYLDTDTIWTGTDGTVKTGVLHTGKQMSDCMKAGMNAYIWWYTVRYYGLIDESGRGNVTKRGYVMSQFARFVRPGFFRIFSKDYSLRSFVDVTGYRSGSHVVLVAINRNSAPTNQIFIIWNGTTGTFTPYVTTSSKNCEQQSDINYKNGMFTYPLEAMSVTTFVLK